MNHRSTNRRQRIKTFGVFISHRGVDSPLAERLAKEILSAGYDVWLDKWKIGLGDSIVAQINAGLDHAKYLLLCYSASGTLSPWMSREWMSALARQLEGVDIKILPVRLSGGDPPAILADIKYADLVKDWNAGIADLLYSMR